MNVLKSIRSDLFSKRFAPLLILAVAGLAGAIAYVGGGSGAAPVNQTAGVGSSANTPESALSSVSEVTTNPNQATSETTSGTRYQNQGHAHDPFKAQPQTTTTPTTTTTTSSSSASKSSSSSSSTTTTSSTPKSTQPVTPPAPKPIYVVSVLSGFAPSPGQPANLTAVADIKAGEKLPSAKDQRLVFKRVDSAGTGAIFKLLMPPILHGPARCIPSPENCESIELPIKHAEQLEYAEENGQTSVYEIEVINISKVTIKAGTASAHTASRQHQGQ